MNIIISCIIFSCMIILYNTNTQGLHERSHSRVIKILIKQDLKRFSFSCEYTLSRQTQI